MRIGRIPLPVFLSALFVLLFTCLFNTLIFKNIPHVHDEIAYLFQAKIFELGRLYVPSPCAKESFDFPHMINNGRWYSQYPPGYPMLLLLGLLLGAPWLINPLLAAGATILIYLLGKEVYGAGIGLIASLLASCSIWFLLMSSTMMSHTSSMFFTVLFLLFLFRSINKPTIANGLLMGFGFGMTFLIRPYNALLIAAPFLLFYLGRLLKDRKVFLEKCRLRGTYCMVFIAALLLYNQMTNGSPLKLGYTALYGKEHGLGFGRTGFTNLPYTPYRGADNAFKNLAELNKYLFGWPISSLIALIPLLFAAKSPAHKKRYDLLFASGFFVLLIGYFFYWSSFTLLGPRMLFEALPIFLLLSARGLSLVPDYLGSVFKRLNLKAARHCVIAGVVLFTAYGFLFSFRNWVWPKDSESYSKLIGKDFVGVSPQVNNAIEALGLENSVVIIKFIYYPQAFFPAGWWGSGFLYDDPELKRKIIYANDQGKANERLFDCFPGRRLFVYYGTLEKGMLVPLLRKGEEVVWGEPIAQRGSANRTVDLVVTPQEMFVNYSSEFSDFLERLFESEPYRLIDVSSLLDKGSQLISTGAFGEASHCFEAILQIEKQESPRVLALNQLALCYNKLGKTREARHIIERIADPEHPLLYQVFPDKGF